MTFSDRKDAGRQLAAALAGYKGRNPVVLALPRGGVPVAAEVAEALGAPLDLVLVRKIGLPWQPELAVGAVVDGTDPVIVRNEDVILSSGLSDATFKSVCDAELAEIARRKTRYIGLRARAALAGKVVIVIDDGIATGATMKAALRAIRQHGPRELVLAVPVAPADTLSELAPEVDALVCLVTPEPFGAIGYFYRDFSQVDDDTVVSILARFPTGEPEAGARMES
ncbi:phosphoribosyltransferase [Chelatococcus asaccharovorans]|uniref:phosphoribosyltransferase n=1 Tax=Chelatococcus asaccharovorans TaxID=28210 RepID=UPI00226451BA|nr:phosphoribosyltransferase [Chelatococcus asaccharovorans]